MLSRCAVTRRRRAFAKTIAEVAAQAALADGSRLT